MFNLVSESDVSTILVVVRVRVGEEGVTIRLLQVHVSKWLKMLARNGSRGPHKPGDGKRANRLSACEHARRPRGLR